MKKKEWTLTKGTGIATVAVAITVIVLLILAGVAISVIVAEKHNNAAQNNGLNPEANGQFSTVKGVNTPDTSKLPTATTKYVAWTGTETFTEVLSDKKIADWYDYSNSKWANIKTTSTDGSLEAYWVWIPRFAYKLPENGINPKTIEVAFAKGNGTTVINPTTGAEEQAYYATDTEITTDGSGLYVKKTAEAKDKWIIHPSFTFGNNVNLSDSSNKQLSGIWVAKYEASSTNTIDTNGGSDTNELKVQVKPNVTSWRAIQAKNSFANCRAIQDDGGVLGTATGTMDVDTHLIKNMEWGAVAILSQSKYGNYNRGTNENIQVWNNPNRSYRTGTVGTTKDQESTADESCALYNTQSGIKASTTGNIYGIYDMAGGAIEQVAGVYTEANASNVLGTTELKYYDLYTNPENTYANYDGGKIGDMTRECSPESQAAWNGDQAFFVNSTYPLAYRGGGSNKQAAAGVFAFFCSSGGVCPKCSFRPALVVL